MPPKIFLKTCPRKTKGPLGFRFLKHEHGESPKKICILNKETMKTLSLYTETDPQKIAEGNYKYAISDSYARGVAAFRTEAGLNKWLHDTGITVGKRIDWLLSSKILKGSYQEISLAGDMGQLRIFGKKHKLRSSQKLDNARFTRSFIQEGKTGNNIYYLNPNYPREDLPYKHL